MNSEGHPMTKPLVPRKLVWFDNDSMDSPELLWAHAPGVEYRIFYYKGTDLFELQINNTFSIAESLESAQAAAQQHYNELVTSCCEVKRCVWKYQDDKCSIDTECGEFRWHDIGDYMVDLPKYCQDCGGRIQVEGGE